MLLAMDVGWAWKATDHWVRPRTARDVMSVIGSIGVYSTGQQFAWRGMASADFSLTSSLHRRVGGSEEAVRAAELDILEEARTWGLGTHPLGHVDDLQLLSDLQHFGIPTRLIDVTSNPMTALWFACQPAPSDHSKSGLLLALNVTSWERVSTVAAAGQLTWGQVANPSGSRLQQRLEAGKPFVVESASPNARLRAQEGSFVSGAVPVTEPIETVTTDEGHSFEIYRSTPFESIDVRWPPIDQAELEARLTLPRTVGAPRSLPFVAVIITAGLKTSLLKYLAGTYNRSARVLFPDYLGYFEHGRSIPRL